MKLSNFSRIVIATIGVLSFPAYYGWTAAFAGSSNQADQRHSNERLDEHSDFIAKQVTLSSFVSLCADAGLGGPDAFSQGQYNETNCPPVESFELFTPIDGIIQDSSDISLDVTAGPYQSSCATTQSDAKTRTGSMVIIPWDLPDPTQPKAAIKAGHSFHGVMSSKVNSQCDPNLPPEDTMDCSAAASAYYHVDQSMGIQFHTSLKKLTLRIYYGSLNPPPGAMNAGYSLSLDGHVIYSGTVDGGVDGSLHAELLLPQEGDYVLTFWGEYTEQVNATSHCAGADSEGDKIFEHIQLIAAFYD